jgi:uncharacterized protein
VCARTHPLTAATRGSATGTLALALALLIASWLSVAHAQGPAWETGTDGLRPVPPLAARVTDLAQTLSPAEQQALEAKLADWEARTANQLAVLIVPTTQPEPIEAYSIRVVEAWKLGRKGNDNGVLFLVAKNDKKMRIEVGYGFEGTLTDVTARRIIAEDVAPLFREGKFAAGINAGVDRITKVVADGKELPPPPAGAKSKPGIDGFDFETLALILFIGVPVVGMFLRSMFGKLAGSAAGSAVVGAAAWLFVGSLVVAIIAAIVAFFVIIFSGSGGGGGRPGRGGGMSLPGGSWGGGGSSGGGGFSGGGGSFGGGGASGGWD